MLAEVGTLCGLTAGEAETMTPVQVAHNLFESNPKSSPSDVRKLAEKWSRDPEFLDNVVARYTVMRMKRTRFSEDAVVDETGD
ncbi:MAG: hypothetical protein DWQ29_15035 [Planctomycetota bacterium]|nr:MAG: hypothetical protein DWQ29_15035 [Planctomycetota bacterium]